MLLIGTCYLESIILNLCEYSVIIPLLLKWKIFPVSSIYHLGLRDIPHFTTREKVGFHLNNPVSKFCRQSLGATLNVSFEKSCALSNVRSKNISPELDFFYVYYTVFFIVSGGEEKVWQTNHEVLPNLRTTFEPQTQNEHHGATAPSIPGGNELS